MARRPCPPKPCSYSSSPAAACAEVVQLPDSCRSRWSSLAAEAVQSLVVPGRCVHRSHTCSCAPPAGATHYPWPKDEELERGRKMGMKEED